MEGDPIQVDQNRFQKKKKSKQKINENSENICKFFEKNQ